jgi:hypothetical protein
MVWTDGIDGAGAGPQVEDGALQAGDGERDPSGVKL